MQGPEKQKGQDSKDDPAFKMKTTCEVKGLEATQNLLCSLGPITAFPWLGSICSMESAPNQTLSHNRQMHRRSRPQIKLIYITVHTQINNSRHARGTQSTRYPVFIWNFYISDNTNHSFTFKQMFQRWYLVTHVFECDFFCAHNYILGQQSRNSLQRCHKRTVYQFEKRHFRQG